MVELEAPTDMDEVDVISFYSYYASRGRCCVVKSPGARVKDLYIVPLAGGAAVPEALANCGLEGPGITESSSDRLFGVMVLNLDQDMTESWDQRAKAARSPAHKYTPNAELGSPNPDDLARTPRTPPTPVDRPYSPSQLLAVSQPADDGVGHSPRAYHPSPRTNGPSDSPSGAVFRPSGALHRSPAAPYQPPGMASDSPSYSPPMPGRAPAVPEAPPASAAAIPANIDFMSIRSALAMVQSNPADSRPAVDFRFQMLPPQQQHQQPQYQQQHYQPPQQRPQHPPPLPNAQHFQQQPRMPPGGYNPHMPPPQFQQPMHGLPGNRPPFRGPPHHNEPPHMHPPPFQQRKKRERKKEGTKERRNEGRKKGKK